MKGAACIGACEACAIRCESLCHASSEYHGDCYFLANDVWLHGVNVGLRIPGIQTQLKALAKLPDQLALLSSKEGEGDGMMGLIRRASHLFNLVTGKVVGSNGYRVACRHKFTAYTIFFGAPMIFCTPNIADNRNVLILLCQGMELNLDLDADLDLRLTYEELRLRVVNDTAFTFVRASHFARFAWLCGATRGHCCGATCLDE